MINYAELLTRNPSGVFATLDGETIRTRVFLFLFADGNKVYFCTSKEKRVYSQIKENPNVSFCTYAPDFSPVLSLSGKAVFTDDARLKTRAMDENPMLKQVYAGPDNPMFALFYIDVKEVETFSDSEGVRKYTA